MLYTTLKKVELRKGDEAGGLINIWEENMKVLSNSLLLAVAFGGSITTATASSVSVTASEAGLGSFSVDFNGINKSGYHQLDLSKTFSSVNPIVLTFTVSHSDPSGREAYNIYDIYEDITNNTTSAFTEVHLQITEPVGTPSNGVKFQSFDPADQGFGPDFTPSFALDSPSEEQLSPFQHTGPRDLNFTGQLMAGGIADDSYFSLNMPDPHAGNTYTFTLTQTPVGVVPELETYALMLAGLGLVGFMARRKQNASSELS